MSSIVAPPATSLVKTFTANLSQAAGTYDLFTSTGQNTLIKSINFYVGVAAAGLTSITVQSNNTTPVALLASTALAALTADKNLTAYVGPFLLPSTKKVQYTIVGTGSGGGTLLVTVEFYPGNLT